MIHEINNEKAGAYSEKEKVRFVAQTNGKYEKWNHTYELHRHKFETFEEFVKWCNNRLHGSHNLKTPELAFWHKVQDIILGRVYKWAEENQ